MQDEKLHGQRLTIPARLCEIDAARAAFQSFLDELGLPPAETDGWLLALTEAAVNAVRHGCGGEGCGEITLSWRRTGVEVSLEVADTGHGPPQELMDAPGLPNDPLSERGRGLFIIRQFCHRWEHLRGSRGYRLLLEKDYPELLSRPTGDRAVLDAALAEISQCYESLAAFYRLGDALIGSENARDFIGQVTQDLARVVPHDHLLLQFNGSLQSALLEDLRKLPCTGPRPGPIEERVIAQGRECVWETSAESAEDPVLSRFACGICAPIRAANRILGTVSVTRVKNSPYLNSAELNTIRTFADLFGIAIANANNALVRGREQRALRELEIAAMMQQNLLPLPDVPERPAWRVFTRRRTAREVAGDYVDLQFSTNGDLYLVMVDVMGKSVPAAFLAAMLRTALSIHLGFHYTLIGLMLSLNRILCRQVGDLTVFATCAIARVSRAVDRVEIVNAGHCPVLLLDPDGAQRQIAPSGPPLGLFPDISYQAETFALQTGSRILMLTDGLYEWETTDGTWGWERFLTFLKDNPPQEGEALWEALQAKITAAQPSTDPADDQTLLLWEKR